MNEADLPRFVRVGLRRVRRAAAVRRPRRFDTGMLAGPDFMCIGGQRCGTQWLYDQLEPHPDFWMPPYKELHYFDGRLPETYRTAFDRYPSRAARRASRGHAERDQSFFKAAEEISPARLDPNLYARLFPDRGDLITGDITPCYSILNEREVDRIVQRFPALKVVFIVRDPVERFWSQVNLEARRGTVRALDPSDDRAVLALAREKRFAGRSMLSQIARRWRDRLPAGAFEVFFFDDLAERPADVRAGILHFLSADPQKGSGKVASEFNRKADHKKLGLPGETRRRLAGFFERELEDCGVVFGGRARDWAGRYSS